MRVLLTRSALHNMLFRQAIEECIEKQSANIDVTVMEAPLLEQVPVVDSVGNLQEFLQDKKIEEVIFISPSSVDFGAERVFEKMELQRVFAVGKGTANMLKTKIDRMSLKGSSEFEVVFPTQNVGSQGLLDLPAMKAVENMQILIVTGSEGKPDLERQLLDRGAQVNRWECYQRQKPVELAAQLTKILEQPLSYVFLHSSHAAKHFLEEIPEDCSMHSTMAIVGAKSIAEELKKHEWEGGVEIAETPMPKDMLKVFKQQLI